MKRAVERFPVVEGVLSVECAPSIVPRIQHWLPRDIEQSEPAASERGATPPVDDQISVIRVRKSREAPSGLPPTPKEPRTLALGGCDAWVDGESLILIGNFGRVRGFAALNDASAEIHFELARKIFSSRKPPRRTDAPIERLPALEGALTIAAAMLLGRRGRALAHSGAIVARDGRAWLVVGDSHSGKSTLTATAISGGWRYLSDDQCVFRADADGVVAEGWPRDFHLDDGWFAGAPTDERSAVHPERDIAAGRWQRSARVAGTLLPSVEREHPTTFERVTAATSLAAMIRQSPWLAADPHVARELMAILARVSALPSYAVRMGLDSYEDRTILSRLLEGVSGQQRTLDSA